MVVTINGGVRYPIGVAQYTGVTHPNFRGASTVNSNSVFEKTPLTDTVEISSKEEKKKGLSTGAKWGIGLVSTALAIYGSVATHRAITRPTLEKTAESLSEIFGRKIGTDEAKTLLSEYKKLFKIKDTNEFYEKAFKQVQKDYGLENAKLKLELLHKGDGRLEVGELGSCRPDGNVRIRLPFSEDEKKILLKNDKFDAISTMIHEIKHAKQYALISRLPDDVLIDGFSKSFKKNYVKTLSPKSHEGETRKYAKKMLKEAMEKENRTKKMGKEVTDNLQNVFKPLNLEKLKSGTDEYDQALKYLKENVNYISPSVNYARYSAQLIEKEAYKNNDTFKKLKNRIRSIWRID